MSDFALSRAWFLLPSNAPAFAALYLQPLPPLNADASFFKSITLSDVVLRVRNLEPMLEFYRDLLGFRVVTQEAGRVGLSANGLTPSLFVLELTPSAPPRPPGSSGLFHAAVLYPDRGSLGRIAQTLVNRRIRFATGDHGVSEAFYLDDPEGNGIELYADRPVESWPKPLAAGDIVGMYTEAVDLEAIVQAGHEQPGPLMPPDTRLGHVHLSVADLRSSEKFYHQVLGFDVMVRSFPGAVFLGRDGYHHHLGANVWRSRTPATPGVLGLARFTVRFTRAEEFARIARELAKEEASSAIAVRDPSGIEIVITASAT